MRHNGRAPLLISTLRSDCVTVNDDEIRSVICADCGTWRMVRRGMVAAHRAEPRSNQPADRSGQRKPQDRVLRCEGSGQRIKFDRRHREAMPAENRRAAQQFYKPIPTPARPVHRIVAPLTADGARQKYEIHRERCAGCTERATCATGRQLLAAYATLLREEPQRCRAREFFARERARFDRQYAVLARESKQAEWTRQREATADSTTFAKRAGTAVEEGNNSCRTIRPGAVSELRAPGVPTMTLHPGGRRPEPSGLECTRCGGTETDLVHAAAAGWRRVRRQMHCGPCAGRFPAWMTTAI